MPIHDIIYFEKASSSQDLIKDSGLKYLNQLVHVNHQKKGYGTFKKPWISNPSDLTFSFLVKKHKPHRLMLVLISLMWYETLLEFKSDIFIKPPNDIYTQQGKLSGILIEEKILNAKSYWVCGIGINFSPKNDPGFKNDYLHPKISKTRVLESFLDQYNGFHESDTLIIEKYVQTILNAPILAHYKDMRAKVRSIDKHLNIHTDQFRAPIEWVTFEALIK